MISILQNSSIIYYYCYY